MKRMMKRIAAFTLACVLLCSVIPTISASEMPYTRDIDVIVKKISGSDTNVYTTTVSKRSSGKIQAEGFGFTFTGKNLVSSILLKVHQITPDTEGYDWFASCMDSFGGKIAPFDIYCVKNGKRVALSSSLSVTVTLPKDYAEPALYFLDANGSISPVSISGRNSRYTFTVSKAGYYVFVDAADMDDEGDVVTYYTVTASAGKGGKISPSGSQIVEAGADLTFTITPEDGYQIKDVAVDGTSIGAVESYTLEDIQSDHKITATFERTKVTIGTIISDLIDWFFGGWFKP